MCVIIVQPKEGHLKKDRAERLWRQNPDGGGFTYIEEGKIETQKYMHFNEFWRAFETTRSRLPKEAFLIHLRIATHGTVNLDNVHPFVVNEHTVMAHNGVFAGLGSKTKSDTKVFIEEILPSLPDDWMDNEVLFNMVEAYIGYNKLAFMTTDPNRKHSVYVCNAGAGVWVDKMWFSNNIKVNLPPPKVEYTWVPYDKDEEPWRQAEALKAKEIIAQMDANKKVKETVDVIPDFVDDMPPLTEDQEPTLEQKVLEEGVLIDLRADLGLHANIVMSIYSDRWLCYGCDEEVDERSGNCDCWSKVCLDCINLAAECKCGNWSSNLRFYDDLSPSDKTAFLDLFIGDKHDLPSEPTNKLGAVKIGAANTSETEKPTTTVES